jgi:hypothetical protein
MPEFGHGPYSAMGLVHLQYAVPTMQGGMGDYPPHAGLQMGPYGMLQYGGMPGAYAYAPASPGATFATAQAVPYLVPMGPGLGQQAFAGMPVGQAMPGGAAMYGYAQGGAGGPQAAWDGGGRRAGPGAAMQGGGVGYGSGGRPYGS